MKDLITIAEYASKDPFSIFSILLIGLLILTNLDKITGLINVLKIQMPLTVDLPQDDSISLAVLKDLEYIRWFKKFGLPYMECYTREKVFHLHKLLKGKMSYGEISLAANHIDSDNNIEFKIIISKMEYILNVLVKIFLGILVIPMGIMITIIAGDYLKTLQEFMFVISFLLLIFYIFIVVARLIAPVSVSIKLKKIVDRELLKDEEKK